MVLVGQYFFMRRRYHVKKIVSRGKRIVEDIQHISDTAAWIAAYRALESERFDAVFKDTLARKLAGTRGFSMVETTPNTEAMAFAMVTRTTAIDRLVQNAISRGADTVINLGAGLDTRPYRMRLPPTLQWIEVDFPSTVDYKNELLKNDTPACKLHRIAADLSVEGERKTLFERLARSVTRALVITEGVVGYLKNEEAIFYFPSGATRNHILSIPIF